MPNVRSTLHTLLFSSGGVARFAEAGDFSEGYIYAVIRGEKRPSQRFIEAASSYLGLSPDLIWPAGEERVVLDTRQVEQIQTALSDARRALAK